MATVFRCMHRTSLYSAERDRHRVQRGGKAPCQHHRCCCQIFIFQWQDVYLANRQICLCSSQTYSQMSSYVIFFNLLYNPFLNLVVNTNKLRSHL